MSKIVKIPLIIIAVLLATALIILAIFQTSWFKNYAADYATKHLSKELGVDVHIGELTLDYFDALTATDVYLSDLQSDTMIYVNELQIDYDLFSFTDQEINLDNVVLKNALVHIGIANQEKKLNIQYLIDYFTPPKNGPSKASPTIILDKISLIDTRFHYFNKNYSAPSDRAFDENNMYFTHLNGHLHQFEIIKDSLSFYLDDISGKEKSGLDIQDLHAKTIISPSTMEFANLYIKTPKSTIKDYLKFSSSSYADYSDFIKTVKIDASFSSSTLHTDDLALFGNILAPYKELIHVDGDIRGTVHSLKSNDLSLTIGNHTSFTGEVIIKEIPNTDNIFFDLDAKRFATNAKDIAKLVALDPIPKEFLSIGHLKYVGHIKGKLSNIEADGKLLTDIGNLVAHVHLSQLTGSRPKYKGHIQSDNINLAKILPATQLGTTAFNLNIQGSGTSTNTLNAKVVGNVSHIAFGKYDYKNITVNGNVKDKIFAGNFEVDDPNYQFDFDGTLDIAGEVPKAAISANVTRINLQALGLDSLNTIVTFNGDIDLMGKNLDNVAGSVNLDSFVMQRNGSTYRLKNIDFVAKKVDQSRNYSLTSDLIKASFSGDFLPSEFYLILDHVKHIISPSQFQKPDTLLHSKNIFVNVDIDQYQSVYKELIGSVLFDSAKFELAYNHEKGKIESSNYISKIKYVDASTPFIRLDIKNGGDYTPLNFSINTGGMQQNDSTLFHVLNANGFIKDGVVHFETTSQRDSILDIILTGRLVAKNDTALVYFDNSKVDIYNKSWNLKNTGFPNIVYSQGITEFRYFDFRNGEEILFLDASMGDNANKINVNLLDFKLANLTPFIAGYNINLQGLTNGSIDVSDREGFPIMEAELEVLDLLLDGDTLGNLLLTSESKDNLAVGINGSIQNGMLNDLKILGDIDFTNKKSPLDLKLYTEKSSLKPFEKFLGGLVSDISGYTTTDISIAGPLASPKLQGQIQLDSLNFLVDYLQTTYTGNATVDIGHTGFTILKSNIYDRFGKKGDVSGSISHNNFTSLAFDIDIENLEDFEILNTQRKDNDLFYGTAFADGQVSISGPMDDIMLQIQAKSRKGTDISIPLDYSEASGLLNYVEFVNLKEDANDMDKSIRSTAGVRMDFNIEITNDANVKLIFDELLGDKIEASGHGNLRMELNTYGDFNMYGGLTIDEGSYLFTALDLINKYFVVSPGGTLFWDGNPYNARIDLDAVKREYPVPLTLVRGYIDKSEEANYSDAIPADCYLKLSGLLFNPEVSFDLEFPSQSSLGSNATNTLNNIIDRIKLDKEELNRQVFALLVLGTFIPPSFSTGSISDGFSSGAANTGINSLSDFASSQLSNWLSQLDTRLQVGVDYQTAYDQEKAELILSLRRKFLNDRLEISYSVDAVAATSTRAYTPYDISVNYNLNEEGNLKIKGFKKQANDPTLGNLSNVSTTGVGLFYRYQFDKFRFRRKKLKPEKKE